MARKRTKKPVFKSNWIKDSKISFCGLVYTPQRIKDGNYSPSFNHMIWQWKYRLRPDGTIRWRIVT